MSIEREDGPVKHYRMKCDSCGKQTKRFADGFDFEYDSPPGWTEDDWQGDGWNCRHYCPKCSGNMDTAGIKEIIPNIGDSFDISDHEAVYRPLMRKNGHTLVIDCQDGCQLVITSKSKIKVEQTEE